MIGPDLLLQVKLRAWVLTSVVKYGTFYAYIYRVFPKITEYTGFFKIDPIYCHGLASAKHWHQDKYVCIIPEAFNAFKTPKAYKPFNAFKVLKTFNAFNSSMPLALQCRRQNFELCDLFFALIPGSYSAMLKLCV